MRISTIQSYGLGPTPTHLNARKKHLESPITTQPVDSVAFKGKNASAGAAIGAAFLVGAAALLSGGLTLGLGAVAAGIGGVSGGLLGHDVDRQIKENKEKEEEERNK